jgi:hypothetical protein
MNRLALPPAVAYKLSDATITEIYIYTARVPRLVQQSTVCPRGNNSQLSILLWNVVFGFDAAHTT